MTHKLWFAAAIAGATLLLGSCQKVAGPTDVPAFAKINGDYLKTGGDGSNWAMTGFNYNEQRHSPLTQINDSNVQDLGIAWFADLPDARGQEATPVVVDGKMFISTAWSKVFSYDAKTGNPFCIREARLQIGDDGADGASPINFSQYRRGTFVELDHAFGIKQNALAATWSTAALRSGKAAFLSEPSTDV